MTVVTFEAGEFLIEARVLADGFGPVEAKILALMRDVSITSRCKAGSGEDGGRWRLTFLLHDRACRIVIDETGGVLRQANFPVKYRSAFGDENRGHRPSKIVCRHRAALISADVARQKTTGRGVAVCAAPPEIGAPIYGLYTNVLFGSGSYRQRVNWVSLRVSDGLFPERPAYSSRHRFPPRRFACQYGGARGMVGPGP